MHDWNVTPREAIEIQERLRDQVALIPLETSVTSIGGCDVSMNRFAAEGFAGFVTLGYPDLQLRSRSAAKAPIPFPYVPGLLSFREIPMLLTAWDGLIEKPDVIMVDGLGIAHPRRLGIASHLGLMLSVPTIGVAKSVLVGGYEMPEDIPGASSPLIHRGEVVGAALRTKKDVKPVFVSPGHLITLEESVALAFSSVVKHRLPEPTRLAHLAVNECRAADGGP